MGCWVSVEALDQVWWPLDTSLGRPASVQAARRHPVFKSSLACLATNRDRLGPPCPVCLRAALMDQEFETL
jgi:hypothetical protein